MRTLERSRWARSSGRTLIALVIDRKPWIATITFVVSMIQLS